MCIENTLMQIAAESSLDNAEKMSLRLISREVIDLKYEIKRLKEQLRKARETIYNNM